MQPAKAQSRWATRVGDLSRAAMSVAVMSSPELPDSALHKRKRSGSPDDELPPASRRRSNSPRLLPKVTDVDPIRRAERERQLAVDAKAEFAKLVGSRSGGVYMPPARLRALQAAAASDKSSAEYQRLSWDALRKSITGIVNRVNIVNIKAVAPELFSENLIRGRGLFARSIMKAQAASLPFTPVFAALVAIINTKLPQVGELVLARLISQFRRAFKRNDKIICHSTTRNPSGCLRLFEQLLHIEPCCDGIIRVGGGREGLAHCIE
ncbi:armadillo-type protein [Mycena amicta]|nr:armadillo-type protein [Mycena amicta]